MRDRSALILVAGIALASLVVMLAPTDASALPQQHSVRTWSEIWTDTSRLACRAGECGPRTLVTHIWAPADGGGYPVAVFAHGFNVDPTYYAVFLRELAGAGYVVVAPELPEATPNGPCCATRTFTALQAGDVSFALTQVLIRAQTSGTAWAGLVTPTNPVVLGHSDGAAVAAAVLSSSVADARFAGGVPIASALDPEVPGWGARQARTLVVHGDGDTIDPIAAAQPVYNVSASPKAFLAGTGRSHSGVILDADAEPGRQAIIGWLDWITRFDVSGLGRFRGWATSPGWYLKATSGLNWSPIGVLETATGSTLAINASGWAMDPETVFPIYVDVSIDGVSHRVAATQDRADVGLVWKNGDAHGFAGQWPATAGPHQVCARAVNVGAGTDSALGCREVTVTPPPPSMPTGVSVRPYSGSVSLWWEPNPVAESVTGYTVTCSCGAAKTVTTTSTSFAGLADGVPVTFSVQALNAGGTGPPAGAAATPSDVTARLLPVSPVRVLDTREGPGPLGPRQVRHLNLEAPAGAVGAVVAVTAVNQSTTTYLAVGPTHEVPGDVSSLNADPTMGPVTNQLVVPLGNDGDLDIYNNSGTTDVLVDLMGWMTTTSGLGLVAQAPQRLVDTRAQSRPVGPGQTLDLQIGDPGGAVALVVTSTGATADSFLTAWGDGPRPWTSIQNPRPGLDRAASVIVPVDSEGQVHLFNNHGTTDIVVDVVGRYRADGAGWHPQAPWRLYDSRTSGGPLTGDVPRRLSPASTVQANLTVTEPRAAGFLAAWGSGSWPGTSNVNFSAGMNVAQQAATGDLFGLTLWSNVTTHAVVDVTGQWR